MKGGANNNDESVNVYIEFLLFTVILTTILSVFCFMVLHPGKDVSNKKHNIKCFNLFIIKY